MASDDSAEHQFVQWAKQVAAPICTLDPSALDTSNIQLLQQAVGDARVVVLSEAFHNCKDLIYLHHRVIRFLCEGLALQARPSSTSAVLIVAQSLLWQSPLCWGSWRWRCGRPSMQMGPTGKYA